MSLNGSPLPRIDDDGLAVFDIAGQASSPEKRLLVAILERAILDYVGNDEAEVEGAEAWLFDSNGDEEDPDAFSFLWTCNELDLDPKFVKSKVQAMPKRGKNRIAPWYFMKAQ